MSIVCTSDFRIPWSWPPARNSGNPISSDRYLLPVHESTHQQSGESCPFMQSHKTKSNATKIEHHDCKGLKANGSRTSVLGVLACASVVLRACGKSACVPGRASLRSWSARG